jgi:hypothetical protein
MRCILTLCVTTFASLDSLLAQVPLVVVDDPAGRSFLHYSFLPGHADPVKVLWRGPTFEIRAGATTAGTEGVVLGQGSLSGGDLPSVLGLEPLDADNLLMVGLRPSTAGPQLQLGQLRRQDGAWRLIATATVEKVLPSFEVSLPAFSRARLVAWDEAKRAAKLVVQQNWIVPAKLAGGADTAGAVIECSVPLELVSGDVSRPRIHPHLLAPVAGQLIAVGTEIRTTRCGSHCTVSTLVDDEESVGAHLRRLRAWHWDPPRGWQELEIPRLLVQPRYEISRTSDGTLVVVMLDLTGRQQVVRTARWQAGQRGFVVDERPIPRPLVENDVLKDVALLWERTAAGLTPWTFDAQKAWRIE